MLELGVLKTIEKTAGVEFGKMGQCNLLTYVNITQGTGRFVQLPWDSETLNRRWSDIRKLEDSDQGAALFGLGPELVNSLNGIVHPSSVKGRDEQAGATVGEFDQSRFGRNRWALRGRCVRI